MFCYAGQSGDKPNGIVRNQSIHGRLWISDNNLWATSEYEQTDLSSQDIVNAFSAKFKFV